MAATKARRINNSSSNAASVGGHRRSKQLTAQDLWMLRLRLAHREASCANDDALHALWTKLAHATRPRGRLTKAKQLALELRQLEEILRDAEEKGVVDAGPETTNVTRLAAIFELRPLERDLLLFALKLDGDQPLRNCIGDGPDWTRHVAMALGADVHAVEHALRPQGALCGSGLLKKERHTYNSDPPVHVPGAIAHLLRREHTSARAMMASIFGRLKPPRWRRPTSHIWRRRSIWSWTSCDPPRGSASGG